MPDIKRNDADFLGLRRQLIVFALPRLSEIPPAEWNSALEKSRNIDFDGAERVAIVVSVGFVTALLSFSPEQIESFGFFSKYAIQFALALPMLIALLAPFYLRRLRRGLDAVISTQKHKTGKGVQP
jgi:hypothetical protein